VTGARAPSRQISQARLQPVEARTEGLHVDREAQVYARVVLDALGGVELGHRAHVLVERHAKLRDRRRPSRELQRGEEALERVERDVEIRRAGARARRAERPAHLEQALAHPVVALGPVLGRGRRDPRGHNRAHPVARRVAEARLGLRPAALLLDKPREQLALELRPGERAADRTGLGQWLTEGLERLRRHAQGAHPRLEREEVQRAAADPRRRVFGEHRLHPHPPDHRVGRRRAGARRDARIGRRQPVDRLVLGADEVRGVRAVLLERSRRRRRRRGAGGGARRRPARRGEQRSRERRCEQRTPHHAPIAFTTSRLSRCPSNSA
jgi:hypothetical protein